MPGENKGRNGKREKSAGLVSMQRRSGGIGKPSSQKSPGPGGGEEEGGGADQLCRHLF